jgi:hypothetical protein
MPTNSGNHPTIIGPRDQDRRNQASAQVVAVSTNSNRHRTRSNMQWAIPHFMAFIFLDSVARPTPNSTAGRNTP